MKKAFRFFVNCLAALSLLAWLGPLLAAIFDSLLWFAGAEYRFIAWNINRVGFTVFWSIFGFFLPLAVVGLFADYILD